MNTPNDNLRYYIGELETQDDIDVVFKHIFDLMLANGGEGSGLDADMLDGYHASDFAPASIVDEIENCIHSITVGDIRYEGRDVVLELLAEHIKYINGGTVYTVQSFLDKLSVDMGIMGETVSDVNNRTSFLADPAVRTGLINIINNNLYCDDFDGDGTTECYLDANSVNGLSFILVTQYQYDTDYTESQKNDPHNIFIINENADEFTNYAPPSVLRAGMNLEFRINNADRTVEYSIGELSSDKEKIWHVAFPLIASENDDRGILHPAWFAYLKEYIDDASNSNHNEYIKQSNYPFLLNDSTNATALETLRTNTSNGDTWMTGVKLDSGNDSLYTLATQKTSSNTTTKTNAEHGVLELNLDTYIGNYISANASLIKTALNVPSLSGYEKTSNKVSSISSTSTNTQYPSAAAVYNALNSLNTTINQHTSNVNNIYDFLTTVYRKQYSISDAESDGVLRFTSYNIKEPAVPYKGLLTKYYPNGSADPATIYWDNNGEHGRNRTFLCNVQPATSGTSPISFYRQGNICQVRIYMRTAIYKNNADDSTKTYYEIPICVFPEGYRPMSGGYFSNPIYNQSSNNTYGFLYYHIANTKSGDELEDDGNNHTSQKKFLSLLMKHQSKIGYAETIDSTDNNPKVLLAFSLTYFTNDSILSIANDAITINSSMLGERME